MVNKNGRIEGARIQSVCENDAEFLHLLMNCPPVLQRLNEVPTKQQDWIDAISEWEHDDDEEDYIVFDGNTPNRLDWGKWTSWRGQSSILKNGGTSSGLSGTRIWSFCNP